MNQLGTVYATKRRRRNGKSLKPSPKESSGKSNPSKRHRERLNAELDTLASLLPYEASILSKLDRLSILRLSVSYLRTKSYFQVSCHKGAKGDQHGHFLLHDNQFRNRDLTIYDSPALDGECFLQALNGFLLILTSDGEVFFATHTIESYLGFHQSDVVHQSVYELVHSEDREELQRQLTWNSQLPPDSGLGLVDALRPDNAMILERSFTVRFRCLLDNTSGFLRLDIRGRVKVLHGQNRKTEEPPLALFAICTPFGPPSLLELPHKESMFKSKHRLDLALVSMDQRGKTLLGYSDAEMSTLGGYDLVHYDDLAYVASAHQELLKTGASGLIAYRLQAKDGQFQWLQTSSRLVYKNSKPDFIISTHRPLMEEEGRDLLGKRTMDFKVSYLDAGLTSSYFSDQESSNLSSATATNASTTPNPAPPAAPQTTGHATPNAAHPQQKVGRKYKNQLRDFLTNCRTKRKSGSSASTPVGNATPPEPSPYLAAGEVAGAWPAGGGSAAAVAAVSSAAAYSPSVYPGSAAVPYHADNNFYHSMHHHQLHHHQSNALPNLPNLHQGFYAPTLDNRFGIPPSAEHNLFHAHHHGYRSLAGVGVGVGAAGYYAADYSPYVHAATTNGFLAAGYDSTMGMSQLYGSSNSSPGGASPAGADAAGKYPGSSSSSLGSAVPPIRLGLHHHAGGGLLSSGETEASETSSTGVSSGGSIAGGDSPYSNGHLHQQQQHQQQSSRGSRPSSRKPGDQHMMHMNGLAVGAAKGVDELAKSDGQRHSSGGSSAATAAAAAAAAAQRIGGGCRGGRLLGQRSRQRHPANGAHVGVVVDHSGRIVPLERRHGRRRPAHQRLLGRVCRERQRWQVRAPGLQRIADGHQRAPRAGAPAADGQSCGPTAAAAAAAATAATTAATTAAATAASGSRRQIVAGQQQRRRNRRPEQRVQVGTGGIALPVRRRGVGGGGGGGEYRGIVAAPPPSRHTPVPPLPVPPLSQSPPPPSSPPPNAPIIGYYQQ